MTGRIGRMMGPTRIEVKRIDRLNVEDVLRVVCVANVKVCIVLKGRADQIADGILCRLAQVVSFLGTCGKPHATRNVSIKLRCDRVGTACASISPAARKPTLRAIADKTARRQACRARAWPSLIEAVAFESRRADRGDREGDYQRGSIRKRGSRFSSDGSSVPTPC